MNYDYKWEYTNNNTKEVLTGVKADLLSTVIAYARDMEAKNHTNKDSPTNWTKDELMLWCRNEYNNWKSTKRQH